MKNKKACHIFLVEFSTKTFLLGMRGSLGKRKAEKGTDYPRNISCYTEWTLKFQSEIHFL